MNAQKVPTWNGSLCHMLSYSRLIIAKDAASFSPVTRRSALPDCGQKQVRNMGPEMDSQASLLWRPLGFDMCADTDQALLDNLKACIIVGYLMLCHASRLLQLDVNRSQDVSEASLDVLPLCSGEDRAVVGPGTILLLFIMFRYGQGRPNTQSRRDEVGLRCCHGLWLRILTAMARQGRFRALILIRRLRP